MDGDKLVNKKTLPVRFGKTFARNQIAILCFAPFLLQGYWIAKGFYFVSATILLLPLALKLTKLVFSTEPSSKYNQFLGMAAALHLFFGVLTSIGLILK
jgi:1,4-dihydroxy-2-naphthoate octaprenyltransferase